MRLRFAAAALIGALAVTFIVPATPAYAICKKLGFTVNHYGKKGPTEDSKRLLDGYLDSWTAERGIKKWRRKGKKTVSCYQFLDFGFFDEWTCKAVQEICFRGKKIPEVIAKKGSAAKKTASKKKAGSKKKYSKKYTKRMKYKKKSKTAAKKAAKKKES